MVYDVKEHQVFARRWAAHPLRMGTFLPSSESLAQLVAEATLARTRERVVELGPGTGAITKTLLNSGLPESELIAVEVDTTLHEWISRELPSLRVIRGDAFEFARLLPRSWIGGVGTVISGIPVLHLPLGKQEQLVHQCLETLRPDGQILQYTYSVFSPLQFRALGLEGERIGFVWKSCPPASLWRYRRRGSMG